MNVEIPIELVNWKKNSSHVLNTVKFGNATMDATSRVIGDKNRANNGWGFNDFCSHTNSTRDLVYLEDDCLYFRVKQPIIHSKRGFFV